MTNYNIPLAKWQSTVKTAGVHSKARQHHSQQVLPQYSLIQETERKLQSLDSEKVATEKKLKDIQGKIGDEEARLEKHIVKMLNAIDSF